MDVLSFIASISGSLAWPAAVLVVVFMLRTELVSLLPSLRRLKAGPLEAEFEREVKELKSEVAASLPPPEPKAIEDKTQRLIRLAEISPRGAIVEAWQGVEFAAQRALIQYAGSPIPDTRSAPYLVRELARHGLLAPESIVLFNELRGLRNQAIHVPDFNPSFEAVTNFVQMAATLQARLEDIAGSAQDGGQAKN